MENENEKPKGAAVFDDVAPAAPVASAEQPSAAPAPAAATYQQEDESFVQKNLLTIIVLLLMILFLGAFIGLYMGQDKEIDKATVELNQATVNFEQAAKAITTTTSGGDGSRLLSIPFLETKRTELKAFFKEIFIELGLNGGQSGGGDFTHKVYLTGDQAQLIADAVANKARGGNPEELKRLRDANGDLATMTDKQLKAINKLEQEKNKLKEANAKLEGRLETQPAPQLVIPDDTEAKEQAEKLAGESRIRSEKLDKKLERILAGQENLSQGQKLNKDQVEKLIAESKDIAGQKEAEEKAKTCPAGTSVPLIKSDKPFKWYIIMNPEEYAELKAAAKEDREGIEDKYSGRADVLIESVFIPVCITIGEHYILLDQEDGASVVTLSWDGKDLKAASLNHRIMVMFLFAKGGPVFETLGDQNIDLAMGTDYPLLKGRGE